MEMANTRTIEIKVKEDISVKDLVPAIVKKIHKIVENWYVDKDDDTPIVIVLRKDKTRAPPALGISVEEKVEAEERIGGS